MPLSVLILTKNEEQDLPACLASVAWCEDVHLFDSFSTDRTLEIARAAGCVITQRKFENWSAHQNWGLANIPFKNPWVLYIDADERVSPELRAAAEGVAHAGASESAFRLRRRDFFVDGTWLKHAQISAFYLRLFRPNKMRYERLVNPVSIVDGPIGEIGGFLDHYPFSKGVGFWLERHIKYSDLEARTILENRAKHASYSLLQAFVAKDFTERRFHQKEFLYRLPGRPFVKFFYMMVLRRAFLDGRAGVTYAALQSIYEYFIVLKLREFGRKAPTEGIRTHFTKAILLFTVLIITAFIVVTAHGMLPLRLAVHISPVTALTECLPQCVTGCASEVKPVGARLNLWARPAHLLTA